MRITVIRCRNHLIGFFLVGLLFHSVTLHSQTYAVMNATSSPTANGIYTQNGTFYGYPKYSNGSYTLFHTPNQYMNWAIVPNGTSLSVSDVANSPYSYSTKINGAEPPSRAWHNGGNTTGLPGENIIVIPLNSIGYSKHYFTEATSDDGAIMDTVLVYLYTEGITFTGKAAFTGLPSGLSAKLVRKSDTTLMAYLEGNAGDHAMKDNTVITLTLDDTALSNGDVSVFTDVSFGFKLLFQSAFVIEGAVASPGAAGEYPLMGMYNEYPWFVHNDYYLTTKSCNPKWIIRTETNVHPAYSTQIQTDYPGNREWHRGGFYYTMGDSLQVGMKNSILYESHSIIEDEDDQGTYTDSLKIRYYHPAEGSAFSGMVNDDFVADGKILVSNVPGELDMVIRKFNDTTLFAQLTGVAENHEVTDNIRNLKLEFTPEAFTGPGIHASHLYTVDSLDVVNMMKYVLVDTVNFSREVNGIYSAYNIINGCTAYTQEGKYFIVYRNTPPNCVWGVMQAGAQNAVFSSGAEQNTPPYAGWVKGDYNGTAPATIEIFPVQPWLSYDHLTIKESEEIPGLINDTIRIVLNNGNGVIFIGILGDDFIDGELANVFNLPEGVTATMSLISETELHLYIAGSAVHHTTEDNIFNLTIRISNEAINGDPESVKFKRISSGKVLFNDITALDDESGKVYSGLIYPNPAGDLMFLLSENDMKFSICNSAGIIVMQGLSLEKEIDISDLPAGLYLVTLEGDDQLISQKLIIK